MLPSIPSGLLVDDARQAFEESVANGGKAVRPPITLQDPSGGSAVLSEVALYGDVVLRYISGDWQVRCIWQHAQGTVMRRPAQVLRHDDSSSASGITSCGVALSNA